MGALKAIAFISENYATEASKILTNNSLVFLFILKTLKICNNFKH